MEERLTNNPPVQVEQTPTSFQRRDILAIINKNGKYKYRWVNYERIRQTGGIHPNGWRLVTSLNRSEEQVLKEHGLMGRVMIDGCVRLYELALAFMSLDEWRTLKAEKDEARKQMQEKIRRREPGSTTEFEQRKGRSLKENF